MATISKFCSWCHKENPVHADRATWCTCCGHRADVPQRECDCLSCQTPLKGSGITNLADLERVAARVELAANLLAAMVRSGDHHSTSRETLAREAVALADSLMQVLDD